MEPALDSATHCERDDNPENCEIEITPEMIKAGACVIDELSDYSPEFLARQVFCAMLAKPRRGLLEGDRGEASA